MKSSRLLIPLSFAAILGGICTQAGTSTNILVGALAAEHDLAPFGMFEITKMGVCYAAVGAVYMLTVGRNLLPNREVFSALLAPADNREFLTQAIIAPGSPLVGQRFPKTNLLKITEMITNNAAAILLSPVVIQIADDLGVNARPFLVAVMFGASASFATPIGYQTNTYVYGAGGYRFSDFVRVGLPLNIIVWLAAKILIPLMWPFN